MEEIYSDTYISEELIYKSFISLFPGLKLLKWDFFTEEPEGYNSENPCHIVFNTFKYGDKIEFGFRVSFYRTPSENSEERSIAIAQKISEIYEGRLLVPHTLPSSPEDPFYDLIIIKGRAYLSDDSNTNFADGTGGRVRILKELHLNKYPFDSKGHLIRIP